MKRRFSAADQLGPRNEENKINSKEKQQDGSNKIESNNKHINQNTQSKNALDKNKTKPRPSMIFGAIKNKNKANGNKVDEKIASRFSTQSIVFGEKDSKSESDYENIENALPSYSSVKKSPIETVPELYSKPDDSMNKKTIEEIRKDELEKQKNDAQVEKERRKALEKLFHDARSPAPNKADQILDHQEIESKQLRFDSKQKYTDSDSMNEPELKLLDILNK